MASGKLDISADIYTRLVANYPNIHQKIMPDGRPSEELAHVLTMMCRASKAAADRYEEIMKE